MNKPEFNDKQLAYIKEALTYLCDEFERQELYDAYYITKEVFRGMI